MAPDAFTPIAPERLFCHLGESLRSELVACYREIVQNYLESRWEPSELNGGKLCEVIYTIVEAYPTAVYPSRASKPRDFVGACRALEQRAGVPRSLRILIPRMLPALYEIRNNRGVGHVGGDVDPNKMDATVVLETAQWLIAELVRVFHDLPVAEAQRAVDMIVERRVPLVWEVGGAKRVLRHDMKKVDQAMVLLYASGGPVSSLDLFGWLEYSTPSNLRSNILTPLHKKRLLEYDKQKDVSELSPTGIKDVEVRLLSVYM